MISGPAREDEMENFLENLILLLDQETALLENLLHSLERKKKAIIEAKVELLRNAGQEIEAVQVQISQVEQRRKELIAMAAQHMRCLPDALTLGSLSTMAPPHQASRLSRCREKLGATLGRIRALNGDLGNLLSHAIQLVGTSVNVLSGMVTPHFVYGHGGTATGGFQRGRLLSRTI